MRRVLLALMLVVSVLPLRAGTAGAAAGPTIVFAGGGWGHGIGLSQYGAYGQGLEGRSAEQIVRYFYSNTQVDDLAELPIAGAMLAPGRPVWVGLKQHQTTAHFAVGGGPASVCVGPTDDDATCDATRPLAAGDRITVQWTAPNGCTLTQEGTEPLELPACRASIRHDTATVVWYHARGYHNGSIEIRRAPGAASFHVINALAVEPYIDGLAEAIPSWNAAALEAQALAARSYGLYKFLTYEKPELRQAGDAGLDADRKAKCWCHLFSTTADQNYIGIEAEHPNWLAAVDATAGRVITYWGADWTSFTRSHVIQAFYSSSNGGISESNVSAWGSPVLYPYLLPVADPWSANPNINPNARWEVPVPTSTVAASLGWDRVVTAELLEPAPGAKVRFRGTDGGKSVSVTKTGYELRGMFGLKSGGLSQVRMEGDSCAGVPATIHGTPGDDVLLGTPGRDVIVAYGGHDVIHGRAGDDLICAGGGADRVTGGTGNDVIYGNGGRDRLDGGGGNDEIRGGPGSDVLTGGDGNDLILGQHRPDVIDGERGRDILEGGAGTDTLTGGAGRDRMLGNSGNDTLVGDIHRDRLKGGPGNDDLDGGRASDVCNGGRGLDSAARCETARAVP